MKRYDWEEIIKFNILSLRILGLWPKGYTTYTCNFYIIHTLILYTTFMVIHVTVQAVNVYFIRDNLEALVGTSYILLIKILGTIKAFYLMKNMRLLKELMKILNSDLFQPRDENQKELVESETHFWKYLNRVNVTICFTTNVFLAVFPLTSSEYRRLPFLAWYPYNSKASPYYEITYIHQVISVGFNTTVHVNVDTLTAVFCMFAGSQFDLLSDNLRHLADGDDGNVITEVRDRLLICIQHHRTILRYIKTCNKIFNWIIFLQFFISSISIGITLFQLTLVVPFSNEFNSLLGYGLAITMQIFLYCWFGNEVQLKSSNVAYAILQSRWMHLSEKIKKHLLFFTLVLQKPVQISALDLFYLTLETFMKIMKTSWSYFALLHQLSLRK